MDTAISLPPRILSRPLALMFAAAAGAMTSFYLLLSVVPLYATAAGASELGAGLTTGALMLSTVAAEFVTPAIAARLGNRLTLAIGLFLLGAPALLFPLTHSLTGILAICLLRGLGFAITVVIGAAVVAQLVPASRRGEGLGLYGIIVGVPGVIALPAGVWAATEFGYPVVFVAGAMVSLIGIAAVVALPPSQSTAAQSSSAQTAAAQRSSAQGAVIALTEDGAAESAHSGLGILAGLRKGSLVRPAIIFGSTAMAGGIVVTFVPLVVTSNVVALALLVHVVAATVTRWWAGRYGDRNGPKRLLFPAAALCAAGIALLAFTGSVATVMTAMVLFGAGFGIAQNASLTVMYGEVDTSGYGTVSALWNMAYDAGYGLGAVGFGVVAAQTGYPIAFIATSALIALAFLTMRRA